MEAILLAALLRGHKCSFHVVWLGGESSSSSFISPRVTTPATLGGTVGIEVNMSVWNEMLSISSGRRLLYVAHHSRINNIQCARIRQAT